MGRPKKRFAGIKTKEAARTRVSMSINENDDAHLQFMNWYMSFPHKKRTEAIVNLYINSLKYNGYKCDQVSSPVVAERDCAEDTIRPRKSKKKLFKNMDA